jgi:hypothetical protein
MVGLALLLAGVFRLVAARHDASPGTLSPRAT